MSFRLGILMGICLIIPILAVIEDLVIKPQIMRRTVDCVRRHEQRSWEEIRRHCTDPDDVYERRPGS